MNRAHSALPLLAALLAGCSQPDDLERTALEASYAGTLAHYQSGTQGNAGIRAAGKVTERYYWVAKYAATPQQREVVKQRAQAIVKTMAKRSTKPKSRYIAVATKRDSRATTQTAVMVWDTQSESIVGNSVYDLNDAPPKQELVKFETYSATYVASGL